MSGRTKKGMFINGKFIPRKDLLRDKCIALVGRIEEKLESESARKKLKNIVKRIVSGRITTKYYTGIISELRQLERGI